MTEAVKRANINMGETHKKGASYLIKTGHLVPLSPEYKERRKAVGLSEIPPTTLSDKKALEEVQKLIKKTGFDKLIGGA